MFQMVKKSGLIGVTLCSLGISAHATEVLLWKVPETKGKAPVFYQEASEKSKPVTLFKPHQTVQVLSKQKDWAKISTLDNSGQIAWVQVNEVKSVTTLAINLQQEANTYQCQVRIKDPEGREAGNWRLAHRMFEPSEKGSKGFKSWPFGKKGSVATEDAWVKELDQFEKAFAQQQAAMLNMMNMFSASFEGIPTEKVSSTTETTQVTEKTTKTEDNIKPSEAATEKEKTTIVK